MPQPLACAEILAYCELLGVTDVVYRQELFYFVRTLDAIWLVERLDQQEKAHERLKNKGG